MGDHDNGPALAVGQPAQQAEHLAARGGVQRAGRLVGEDHFRLGDQRPGDRHPLLLTAELNVALPLRLAGRKPGRRQIRDALAAVGLENRARHRPAELSGGQQQRVAIARALAASPQLLLADEPTGQLDSETAKQIMRLLHAVVESEGVTALVATHDPNLISIADSVLELEDGQIKAD